MMTQKGDPYIKTYSTLNGLRVVFWISSQLNILHTFWHIECLSASSHAVKKLLKWTSFWPTLYITTNNIWRKYSNGNATYLQPKPTLVQLLVW